MHYRGFSALINSLVFVLCLLPSLCCISNCIVFLISFVDVATGRRSANDLNNAIDNIATSILCKSLRRPLGLMLVVVIFLLYNLWCQGHYPVRHLCSFNIKGLSWSKTSLQWPQADWQARAVSLSGINDQSLLPPFDNHQRTSNPIRSNKQPLGSNVTTTPQHKQSPPSRIIPHHTLSHRLSYHHD